MMRHVVRYCAGFLILILLLSGCSSDPAKVEANVFPVEYKKLDHRIFEAGSIYQCS